MNLRKVEGAVAELAKREWSARLSRRASCVGSSCSLNGCIHVGEIPRPKGFQGAFEISFAPRSSFVTSSCFDRKHVFLLFIIPKSRSNVDGTERSPSEDALYAFRLQPAPQGPSEKGVSCIVDAGLIQFQPLSPLLVVKASV